MTRRLRGLVLLPVVLLGCGCVTTGIVRLETPRRTPVEYAPPAEPKSVSVSQREFLDAMFLLTLDTRLPLRLSEELGPVQPTSWRENDLRGFSPAALEGCGRGSWGHISLLAPASPAGVRDQLMLVGAPAFLSERERQELALSYALDAVWDGVAQAVSATVNVAALRALVTSALCTYMLLVVAPEPVTKFIALAMTAYLVAYLGCGPLWNMVEAYRELRVTARNATTLRELEDGGHKFGRVVGDHGFRVAILALLAAAGGKVGMPARGATLPGYARAALVAETNAGIRLAGVGEIQAITVRPGALAVAAAPAAVATTVWAMNNGGDPTTTDQPVRSEKGQRDRGESKTPRLKVPKSGLSGKEGAKDVPSWARGQRPRLGESGKDFARRLLDEKYGQGNWNEGPGTEFNKLRKWGDRSFEDPDEGAR